MAEGDLLLIHDGFHLFLRLIELVATEFDKLLRFFQSFSQLVYVQFAPLHSLHQGLQACHGLFIGHFLLFHISVF